MGPKAAAGRHQRLSHLTVGYKGVRALAVPFYISRAFHSAQRVLSSPLIAMRRTIFSSFINFFYIFRLQPALLAKACDKLIPSHNYIYLRLCGIRLKTVSAGRFVNSFQFCGQSERKIQLTGWNKPLFAFWMLKGDISICGNWVKVQFRKMRCFRKGFVFFFFLNKREFFGTQIHH